MLALLTVMLANAELRDQPLLVSALEFCLMLVGPVERCCELLAPMVELLCTALTAVGAGEAGLRLMRHQVCPLVSGLLAALPVQCDAPAPRFLSMDEIVVLTASAATQVLDALLKKFKDSSVLESAISSDIISCMMEVIRKELQKGNNNCPSIKNIEDLPVSTLFLISPLRESSHRIRLLVKGILDWHDVADVSKTAAAKAVLTALSRKPGEKTCKKLIKEALKHITAADCQDQKGDWDENFNILE